MPTTSRAQNLPLSKAEIPGEDGSIWERISEPGFGDRENLAIVAMYPYQGRLYASTRNESEGFHLWRTSGTDWERVEVEGFTNGPLHAFMNNSYGAMIEFDGRLYVGVGSSYEGAYLYRSVGFEIWRFDGSIWEPVVSNSRGEDESGTITAIAGCSPDDADTTAALTDTGKTWVADQWAGGVLRIESGEGIGRVFDIISNTADTLIVQQNEVANMVDYTVCSEIVPDPNRPDFIAGAVVVGDAYAIGMGSEKNGFGEIWNKNIVDFEVFNGNLHVSVAHNYDKGTRIWKTADGLTWEPDSDYSFGLRHGFDPFGVETGICLLPGTELRNGSPVCSSTTLFGKSAASGTETLYVGGTGSTGCNGRGARVLRYDDGAWNFIVDNFVDDNDEGTNENGFGDAASFITANFQAWSWAEYDDRLFVGIVRLAGARIMYTDSGSADDGAWVYSVGGDSAVPDGFDGQFVNTGAHLFAFDEALYAGTLITGGQPGGADIWRATGPAESLEWSRITGDGFGDPSLQTFQAFCTLGGALCVAGSNLFGNYPGDEPENYNGAVVFRRKQAPDFLAMRAIDIEPARIFVTVNWRTENEQDVAGFNVYRSLVEANEESYRKINRQLIPAGESEYSLIDWPLFPNTTYYYRVEAISTSGEQVVLGPLPATTQKLFDVGRN